MARRSIELGLVLSTLVGLGAACGTEADRPRNASLLPADGGAAGDGSGVAGTEAPTGGTTQIGRPGTRVPENDGGMGGEPPSDEGGVGGNAGQGVVLPGACLGDPGEPPMVATCGDGFRSASEECDDGNVSGADSCTSACQVRDSLPLRPPADGEQLLGDGRHPFAAGCAGAALAFTERAPCHDDGTCDATRPPPPPPAEGRIGWWNLDGNGDDSNGGSHTLTIEGNVTPAPGRFGLGMRFDGSLGSCLTAPIWNEARLQGTPGLTMMAWANPGSTFLCQSIRTILGRGWDYVTNAVCSAPPAPNYPGLAGDIRAVGEQAMNSGWVPWGQIVRNDWTFVAVTWDHQDIKHYVNGAFGSARANPGNLSDVDPMFNIGCSVRGADSARLWSFIGTIDEVVLYDRPLSEAEISAYYLESTSVSAGGINLARFDRQGAFRGITPDLSEGSTPAAAANPVVAELGGSAFAVAWTDIDGDGDGAGIALRRVAAESGALGPLLHANETTFVAQSDPDLLWVGDTLVAAWVDDSNLRNAPDLKVRRFDTDLAPLGAEESLAATSRHEADVALASFGSSWAAAWRSSAEGLETIEVRAGQSSWTVGPFLSGAAGDRPALVELDSQHLLLVFTEGADPMDGGVADVPRLRGAILGAPGLTPSFEIAPRVSPYAEDTALGQNQPNALRADNRIYISWRSSGVVEDPLGEEIWLKELGVTVNGTDMVLDLAINEVPLPRSDAHRTGDQRSPALFPVPIPFGTAIAAAWMDYGPFGTGSSAPGPVVEFMPTPILRTMGGE